MNGIKAIFTTSARVLAALALGCVCLLSCRKASTFEPEPDEPQNAAVVTLCITAGELPAATRADDGGAVQTAPATRADASGAVPTAPATRAADTESENEGESFENYIDINSTHILFFIDNKFSEEFIPEEIEPVGSTKYPTKWNLVGALQNPPAAGFKVVVLANCTLPALEQGETSIEDLCKTAVYDAYTGTETEAFQPSATRTIPMYGVQSYTGPMTFRHNVATDLGQIDVLRAMAKVVVRNTSGKPLSSAAVKGYNCQGTSAPLGLYEQTGTWAAHANAYDDLAACLSVHLPSEATANETSSTDRSVGLVRTALTSDEEVWTGYFPEYLNANTAGYALKDCSVINLKFAGISQEYTLAFRYYSSPSAADDGKRFDMKRNHIYEFNITHVDAYSMDLTLVTKPWTVSEHNYSYDDNVTVRDDGTLKFYWNGGTEIAKDSGNPLKMTFSNAGDIKVTFTIDTPIGAEWIAVFEQKSGDLNHFRFADSGTDRTTGTVTGSETQLVIEQDDKTNGTASLVIYAHYGNISFKASTMLGGEYILEKY